MGLIKWLGRVTLWLVFLPLGLWRSIRHGRRKQEQRIQQAISAAQQAQVAQVQPQHIRGIPSDDLPAAP